MTSIRRTSILLVAAVACGDLNDPQRPLLTSPVTSDACVSINPNSGAIGFWPGDEDARDVVGGFHGVFVNGVTAGAPGHRDGAFDLSSGDDEYVSLPPDVAYYTRHDITIEAWINPVGVRPQIGSTLHMIVTRGWDGDGGWGADLVRHTNDHVSFRIVPPPYVQHYDVQSQQPVQLGNWHHVVGVRRGETIEIWLDGVVTVMNAPTGQLRGIGRSFIGMDPFRLVNTDFDGLIDEVAVWNTALSPGTITALHRAGRRGACRT